MFLLRWKIRITNVCVIAYFMTDLHTSIIIFTKNVSLLQLLECWLCPSSGIWEGYVTLPDNLVPIIDRMIVYCFVDYDKD